MMGERLIDQAALLYEFSLERHMSQSTVRRPVGGATEFGSLLKLDGASLDRPGAADADAAGRLLLRRPL